MLPRFDVADPELVVDPHAVYRRYREEDPVHWGLSSDARYMGTWYVFGYDDAVEVLRDPRFGSDLKRIVPSDLLSFLPQGYQTALERARADVADGAPELRDHVLEVVAHGYGDARMPALRDLAAPAVAELVDGIVVRLGAGEAVDLVGELAVALPVRVIADVLDLPVPLRTPFDLWSRRVMRFPSAPRPSPGWHDATDEAIDRALGRLLADRAGTPGNDLVSTIATMAVGWSRREQILATTVALLVVGHENTAGLLAAGLLALLGSPDQVDLLRQADDRGREQAVDELLRFTSPSQFTPAQFAYEDVEIGGRLIRRGERMSVAVAAANRDPNRFAAPDRLDLSRPGPQHLAFGLGPHWSLGAPMATLLGELATTRLLAAVPDLRLAAPGAIDWRPGLEPRCPARLVVAAG